MRVSVVVRGQGWSRRGRGAHEPPVGHGRSQGGEGERGSSLAWLARVPWSKNPESPSPVSQRAIITSYDYARTPHDPQGSAIVGIA